MKVTLFDFCDTLIGFQTADEYVLFTLGVLQRKPSTAYDKFQLLRLLKGLDRKFLEETAKDYYFQRIRPWVNKPIVEKLIDYEKRGYETYIVSGGYGIYISHFASEYNISGVISNDFLYIDDLFTGEIVEPDCMGGEKIRRLNLLFKDREIVESVSFSDSVSDLPLLKWANRGIVVSKVAHRDWAKNNGFEEILLSHSW